MQTATTEDYQARIARENREEATALRALAEAVATELGCTFELPEDGHGARILCGDGWHVWLNGWRYSKGRAEAHVSVSPELHEARMHNQTFPRATFDPRRPVEQIAKDIRRRVVEVFKAHHLPGLRERAQRYATQRSARASALAQLEDAAAGRGRVLGRDHHNGDHAALHLDPCDAKVVPHYLGLSAELHLRSVPLELAVTFVRMIVEWDRNHPAREED
jgi:hypothetical protein